MKRNLTRQADLQLRRFCHRLTVKQRKGRSLDTVCPVCRRMCLYGMQTVYRQ